MGYTVTYGPVRVRKKQKRTSIILSVLFFGLFCAFARHFYAEDIRALRNIILPGAAIDELIQQLQDGENITTSVAAFCESVLHGK